MKRTKFLKNILPKISGKVSVLSKQLHEQGTAGNLILEYWISSSTLNILISFLSKIQYYVCKNSVENEKRQIASGYLLQKLNECVFFYHIHKFLIMILQKYWE